MPRSNVLLSAGEQATRTHMEGMAADVKEQHMLKCFEKNNLIALLARIIKGALGKPRVADLRQPRQRLLSDLDSP